MEQKNNITKCDPYNGINKEKSSSISQNIKKARIKKIEEIKKPTYRQRKPIFQRDNKFNFAFNPNPNTNMMGYNESHENAEKKNI